MKKQKRETRYVSVLVIYVPDAMALIDMLRYDRCCPATEDESRKIWKLIGENGRGGADAAPSDHVIRLLRFAASDVSATDGRWRSFGGRVIDERSPEADQLDDAAILKLAEDGR